MLFKLKAITEKGLSKKGDFRRYWTYDSLRVIDVTVCSVFLNVFVHFSTSLFSSSFSHYTFLPSHPEKLLLFPHSISFPSSLKNFFLQYFFAPKATVNRKMNSSSKRRQKITSKMHFYIVIYCDKFSSSSAVCTILRCDKIFMSERRKLFNLWKRWE